MTCLAGIFVVVVVPGYLTSVYMRWQEGSKNPPPRALALMHLFSTLNEPCCVV